MGLRVTFETASGVVTADDRTFPVVVCTFAGELDPHLVDQLFDWIETLVHEASRKSGRYVMIFDATDINRPSPAVRSQISKRVDALPPVWVDLNLSALMIIPNPLVRGALTALGWVTRAKLAVTYVESIDLALEAASRDLKKAGIAVPTGTAVHRGPKPRAAR